MDDQIAVVEQHPSTVVGALAPKRPIAQFAKTLLNVIGERPYMTIRRTRPDHEHISDDQEVRDIEKGNVVALLVDNGFGGGAGRSFCVGVGWDVASFFAGRPILGGRRPCFTRFDVEMVFLHVVVDRPGDQEPDRQSVGDPTAQHRPRDFEVRYVEPLDVAIEDTIDLAAINAGSRHDRNPYPFDEFGRPIPRRQSPGAVCSDDENDALTLEALDRVDGIGPSVAMDLAVIDSEVVDSAGREFSHAKPVAGLGHAGPGLLPRTPGWDEGDRIHAELIVGRLSRDEVSDVRGVEGSAEDGSHGCQDTESGSPWR